MIAVSTIVSGDGVIGLNGKQYLLDHNDELMLFKSVDDAKRFIEEQIDDAGHMDENGECMCTEFVGYEEVN
jgi:hypothetical protein